MAAVKTTHLLIFTEQFSSMMKSSLQLVDVLDNLAKETPQKHLRKVVEMVSRDVKHGLDFGDSLAKHPLVFDDIFVNVVRSGMESGQLSSALGQITTYLQVMDKMTRQIKNAMTYPIFMMAALFAVFNGMIFFILPRFSTMFSSFGKELPPVTQALMEIGDFWASSWYLVIGGGAMIIVGFATWISTVDGRALWDEHKLHIPILGNVWRMGALARFLRTLAVQMKNGVRLLDALFLAGDASNNIYIRDIIYRIANDVSIGKGLAQAFREHAIFQGIVLQMIAAGEEAGKLDDLLLSSADYFDRLLADRLDTVTGLINPVLTMFTGLFVAGMMVAIFMPVFQMGNVVG
ncbi:MAG: hypothetical protein COB46_05935 [Rhodospirillaceae bacterium]|nr:MAG: hypothetical protein COB46_05935 [Rhodospirillaceae bacterium]